VPDAGLRATASVIGCNFDFRIGIAFTFGLLASAFATLTFMLVLMPIPITLVDRIIG
jgi:hypothetical protein